MTTLSYYIPPVDRRRRPSALLVGCALLLLAVGLLNGFTAFRDRQFIWHRLSTTPFYQLLPWFWFISFVLLAVGVGRMMRGIRPIALGMSFMYVAANLQPLIINCYLIPGSLADRLGEKAAEIGAVALAAVASIMLCLPVVGREWSLIGKPNRIESLPTPLCAWALGCLMYGSIGLTNFFFYWIRLRDDWPLTAFQLMGMMLAGSIATLCRSRVGWLLCVLSIFGILANAAIYNYIAIKMEPLTRQLPIRGYNVDWHFLRTLMTVLNLATVLPAGVFGIYVGRFLPRRITSVN